MDEKPNNKIEKLLAEYARQRRESAGTPTMHPATRRMLQSEVKQRHGSAASAKAPEPRAGWLGIWPRIAFASGIIAVLALAVVLTLTPGDKAVEPAHLALMTETEELRVRDEVIAPTASPARSDAPVALREDLQPRAEYLAKGAPVDSPILASRPPGSVATTPAPRSAKGGSMAASDPADKLSVPESEGAMKSDFGLFADSVPIAGVRSKAASESDLRAWAATAPQTQAAPTTATVSGEVVQRQTSDADARRNTAVTDGLAQNAITQRFRNIAVVDQSKQAVPPPVLVEFTVQQDGKDLTVVDGDGSVYNGHLKPAPESLEEAKRAIVGADEAQMLAGHSTVSESSREVAKAAAPAEKDGAESRGQVQGIEGQAQISNEAQNYYFHVEGTNRSLNQRVVFFGNMIQNNVVTTQQDASGAVQTFRQQNAPAQQFNQQLLRQQIQNNYINGRVILGNSRAGTELNASSIEP